MASVTSNEFKELLLKKVIDFANDTFKIILMAPGFAYNQATQNAYADISAEELPTANGYTMGGAVLVGITITRDDVNNIAYASWNNPSWLAADGNIEAQGAIIYDDTVAAPTAKPIIGYIDYAEAILTYDGGTHAIANVTVPIT